MSKVLVIGDTHFPFTKDGYLGFLQRLAGSIKPDHIVHIGDVTDQYGTGQYDKSWKYEGAAHEFKEASVWVQALYKMFPKIRVCRGNHDMRPVRVMTAGNLVPQQRMENFNKVWGTTGWSWKDSHTIDGVVYTHHGKGSKYPAVELARHLGKSVVCGHNHTIAGINYAFAAGKQVFGMSVGCGVDEATHAFEYSSMYKTPAMLFAGVVTDGVPQLVPFKS